MQKRTLLFLLLSTVIATSALAFGGGGGGRSANAYKRHTPGVNALGVHVHEDAKKPDIKFDCDDPNASPTTKGVCECNDGYEMKDGKCVQKTEPQPITCNPCEDLVGNDCVPRTCDTNMHCDATQDQCVCDTNYVMDSQGVCVPNQCVGFEPTDCITDCNPITGDKTYATLCHNDEYYCNQNHNCINPCDEGTHPTDDCTSHWYAQGGECLPNYNNGDLCKTAFTQSSFNGRCYEGLCFEWTDWCFGITCPSEKQCATNGLCITPQSAYIGPEPTTEYYVPGCSVNSDCDDWCATKKAADSDVVTCFCDIWPGGYSYNFDWQDRDLRGQCSPITNAEKTNKYFMSDRISNSWWSAKNFCAAIGRVMVRTRDVCPSENPFTHPTGCVSTPSCYWVSECYCDKNEDPSCTCDDNSQYAFLVFQGTISSGTYFGREMSQQDCMALCK